MGCFCPPIVKFSSVEIFIMKSMFGAGASQSYISVWSGAVVDIIRIVSRESLLETLLSGGSGMLGLTPDTMLNWSHLQKSIKCALPSCLPAGCWCIIVLG